MRKRAPKNYYKNKELFLELLSQINWSLGCMENL